ncbi:hypothetical protein [Mucilaginibacter psychrotolerans]|uniref:Uncharacterized protein n=1 Tax=Mucilaginibacter psychrotolerans TaxID=1524096 RepID=A0A4Y8S8Q8_9SPHI|nr:hypothetical protein [Mucilaginibacter psychrotolerans]TFF35483.1 hypothetical protein E2R66_18510 [Mucilaginibacter psychrotolerans]
MKDAKQLVNLVLEAHGGLIKWNQFNTVKAHVSMGGITWGVKGHEGVMNDVYFTGNMHTLLDSWSPMFEAGLRTSFDGKDVLLINAADEIIEELKNARNSFEGHNIMTPWTLLQLAYFCSYATWNYLTTPFIFALPGFHFLEMDPWEENGETWRRLQVIFPDSVVTHSKRQVFYISEDGLLKRHDYWPEVLGNNSAAHYFSDYTEVQGIKVPSKHRIYPLDDASNISLAEPLLVSIDVLKLEYI